MKTAWDYTELANSYLKRPPYSYEAIAQLISSVDIKAGDYVCDVGAGTAHLTMMLAEYGLNIIAIEPNDAMRSNGMRRTSELKNVKWEEGTGEDTRQENDKFSLVTFGSSFNVTNRQLALKESARILKPKGFFACMWNHRDLNDSIQSKLEGIIKSHIGNYDYGLRREDQAEIILQSNLFCNVRKISSNFIFNQRLSDCIEAWSSHGTLHRQAGEKFDEIINEIKTYLNGLNLKEIPIPYTTNIWVAQLID